MSVIICQDCFMMSSNPNDVKQSYCGHCHARTPCVFVNGPMEGISLPIRQKHLDALAAGRVVSIAVPSEDVNAPTTVVMLRQWAALSGRKAEAVGHEEDEHPAQTMRELWQDIKADRARQARATVLLLFLFVGVPLEIWGFLLCPLWLKIVVVLVAMPGGLWAWKGLRRDYKGS